MELTYSPESERLHFERPAGRLAVAVPGGSDAAEALDEGAMVASPVRPDGGSHAVGIGVVVGVHLLIGYALISGLAQKVVNAVRAPVEVRLIEEIKPPPPPPPVPPKQIVKALPKLAPPPPAYVPPPQVQVVAPPPAPTIVAVTQQPVVEPPVQAPAPPAPPAKPAPVQIAVVCPNMVTPTLPRRAEQEGISGSVRAQITIRGGKVTQVDILSSKPRGLFDSAVRAAIMQYGCQSTGGEEVVATQNFTFNVGD